MARNNFVDYQNMSDILAGIEQKISGLGSELTGIYTWQANSQYKIGDVVIVNGSLFICQTVHTSSASFSADVANWILFYADISPWLVNTYYVVNACVIANNKLYQCNTAHTSGATTFDSTEEANWTIISGGGTTIGLWQATTSYAIGDLVIESNKLYRCKTAHTSGASFDATEQANWDAIGGGGTTINDWVSGTNYAVGDLVIYNSSLYKCTTANSDITFISANWQEIGETPNLYASKAVLWEGQAYTNGDVLNLAKAYTAYDYIICYAFNGPYGTTSCGVYSSSIFQPAKESMCRIGAGRDNNSSQILGWLTFSGNTATLSDVQNLTASWFVGRIEGIKFTTGGNGSIAKIPDWASGTSYTDGDFVIYNNRLYKCTITNSDLAFTDSKWQEIGGASLSVKKTTLWSGILYTTGASVTLSDIYDKYEYLLIYMDYLSNTTASGEYWSEGVYWYDPASGDSVDFTSGDTPNSGANSWVTYKSGIRSASLRFSGNTMTLIGMNGLSAPTVSSGGYYISKVVGIEFLASAGSVSDFTGATSSTDGVHGLVPKPFAGDEEKFLCADGTWKDASGGTSINDWVSGTTYAIGDFVTYQNIIYKCTTANNDAIWDTTHWQSLPNIMTGATSSVDGKEGLTPKPSAGDEGKYLRGDGTWQTLTASVYANRNVLFNGMAASVGDYTLSDSYKNYDYLIFCLSYRENTSDTIGYHEGCVWYDTSTEPRLDIATNDSGNFSGSTWTATEFKKTVHYVSLSLTSNTNFHIDGGNLSAPTASSVGYYISKVIGFKFVSGGSSGGSSLEEWKPNTMYSVGDVIVYEGIAYLVNSPFTSGATFSDTNLTEFVARNMVGATASTDGQAGIVPKPTTSDINKFLKGDGTWATAGGAGGLNIIKDLLWEGCVTSSIAQSSAETLNGDYEDYDYLEFVPGWEVSGVPNGFTTFNTAIVETLPPTATDPFNPCISFDYGSTAANSTFEHLVSDLNFTSTSFYGNVYRFKGTNTTTGVSLCLWKIYGIKIVNPLEYSTTEKQVGVWVDGKPLYQVTWEGTTPNTATESPLFKVENVDKIIFMDGTYLDTADNVIPMSYSSQSTNDYCYIFWNKSNSYVTMKVAIASYRNTYCQITVRYTKT